MSDSAVPIEQAPSEAADHDPSALLSPSPEAEEDVFLSPAPPDDSRIDYASLLPLCFQQFCETWNSDSIYSYVSFLVIDFRPDLTRDEAGLFAGFVAGAFFVGNFLSSYLWGYLSDRFGRKKLLMVGGIGTLMSIILFGFSQSIWWAVMSRSLCGILNGNLGIAKSLIGEISTAKTIAPSFGLLGIFWGLGSICGSIAGGILARPAKKNPQMFGGTIFETFPYLLTNLSAAFMMVVGLIITAIFLKEPPARKAEVSDLRSGERENNVLRIVLREKQIVLAISLYVLCGAINTFCKETNPLFFVASVAHGGLNFSSTSTGIMIGITGISTILFQLFAYKKISSFLGLIWSFRSGVIVFSFVTIAVPIAHCFVFSPNSEVWIWSYLIVIFAVQTCASQMLFSSVFALISNSAEKKNMGRVNGVSQSLVALFRALGPPIAGNLFAWSISDLNRSFPLNVFFNYLIQALAFGGVFSLSLALHKSLNRPKEDQEKNEEKEMIVISNANSIDGEEEVEA